MVCRVGQCDSKGVVLSISHVDRVKREDVKIVFAYDELVLHLLVVDTPERLHLWLIFTWECHCGLAESA